MKDKKNLLIGALVVIIILLVILIFLVIKRKSLDIESELIKELYTYVGNNDLQICEGLALYDESEANYDTIKSATKICNAYSLISEDDLTVVKIDKSKKNNTCSIGENITFATDNYEDGICTISKIESEKVNEKYQSIYGKDIENYENFQLDNTTVCNYEDGFYYCGLAENYTYSIGAEPHTFRSIAKASEDDGKVIIYDYFLKVVNDECYKSYNQDNKNNECSKNYSSNNDVDFKFLKKYGTKYKHIFQKDGDKYHWVSSEPVK